MIHLPDYLRQRAYTSGVRMAFSVSVLNVCMCVRVGLSLYVCPLTQKPLDISYLLTQHYLTVYLVSPQNSVDNRNYSTVALVLTISTVVSGVV